MWWVLEELATNITQKTVSGINVRCIIFTRKTVIMLLQATFLAMHEAVSLGTPGDSHVWRPFRPAWTTKMKVPLVISPLKEPRFLTRWSNPSMENPCCILTWGHWCNRVYSPKVNSCRTIVHSRSASQRRMKITSSCRSWGSSLETIARTSTFLGHITSQWAAVTGSSRTKPVEVHRPATAATFMKSLPSPTLTYSAFYRARTSSSSNSSPKCSCSSSLGRCNQLLIQYHLVELQPLGHHQR